MVVYITINSKFYTRLTDSLFTLFKTISIWAVVVKYNSPLIIQPNETCYL